MAVTQGPKWIREETILALDLYLRCKGSMPSKTGARVVELSEMLRSFPYHTNESKRVSFRNRDGMAFKLQNLAHLLSNSSRRQLRNPVSRERQGKLWNKVHFG